MSNANRLPKKKGAKAPTFDPKKMCEVCGETVARFQAPNGQLVCETDYAGLKALDQALRESGLL